MRSADVCVCGAISDFAGTLKKMSTLGCDGSPCSTAIAQPGGRKSGQPRVTPLQYEVINREYYVGAARGLKADWVRNLQANPRVELRAGSKRIQGTAEVIIDPVRFADFLEIRLDRHPLMIGLIMEKAHGLPRRPSRAQLEELGKSEVFVIVHPMNE